MSENLTRSMFLIWEKLTQNGSDIISFSDTVFHTRKLNIKNFQCLSTIFVRSWVRYCDVCL